MQDYALTDVGRVRTRNQDYLYSSSDPVGDLENLYLVADGMGGHKAGDYASRFLVEHIVAFFENHRSENGEIDLTEMMRQAIYEGNRELYRKSTQNAQLSGMGTTLVAATVKNNKLFVANVGDSRLYLCRDGKLSQITRDHSYVEEMVAMGRMVRGSKDYQNKKNIITRAVGTDWQIEVDFFEKELKAGDLILLCSDGLTNMISDQEIEQLLCSEGALKSKVGGLIVTANVKGGKDNIAVVLVDPQVSEVSAC